MIWKIIVEIIVAFVPNKNTKTKLRLNLRNFWSRLKVKRRVMYFGKDVRCGKALQVNKTTYLGDYSSIGSGRILGSGDFYFGAHSSTGDDLLVLTDNHNYQGIMLPYDDTCNPKGVTVGESCWIGARVTLLPGCNLGEGCIVQAGSVVHGIFPPLSIIGGNPAQIFKYRNKEHYEALKAKSAFYKF